MFDRIHVLPNLLALEEVYNLSNFAEQGGWAIRGYSATSDSRIFWYKNLIHTPAKDLFLNKIQSIINKTIIINELYVNGQAHGQCGHWHIDQQPDTPEIHNDGTLVYFLNEWKTIFGGHLMIDIGEVISILPEYNKGILFNSSFPHVGLEPTVHCKTQRESVACKFRIVD